MKAVVFRRWGTLLLFAVLALVLPGCGWVDSKGASAPAQPGLPEPREPIPRAPDRLGRVLTDTTAALRRAIDGWVGAGPPQRGGPPREVALLALYQQRIYVLLTDRPRLARQTIAGLPRSVRGEARDTVTARRELSRLTPPTRRTRFRTGPSLPAGLLLRYYREAQRRFRVSWRVLAAVNFVESAFNKLRSDSSAGAQGPMQFIPSTWDAYGMGGEVHHPHHAILGAANYLRASGAPRNYRSALYAYNRSWRYVDAVLRYARRIRSDPRSYYALYSWQVYVKTPSGPRRITGPRQDGPPGKQRQ